MHEYGCYGLINDAAAKADILLVKDYGLTGCDGSLWLEKRNFHMFAINTDMTILQRLTVTTACLAVKG